MIFNAMHISDLKELLEENRIKLVCYTCKVKITDIAGISGLIVKHGELVAICQQRSCREFVLGNCVEIPKS